MKQLTFFLADDDADDVMLFQQLLHDIDPNVNFIAAKDGQEAVSILKKCNPLPDLILLDLNMPKMDGKECLAFIKGHPETALIPVVIYTTSSQSKDIEETLMSGALCYITKPSGVKELQEIIYTLVKNTRHHLKEAIQKLNSSSNIFVVI
ncbi:MAG: response regulator [Bacteroidota bacterium]